MTDDFETSFAALQDKIAKHREEAAAAERASIRKELERVLDERAEIRRREILAIEATLQELRTPEFGQKLLPFLLPRKLRDAVIGDLTEDFRAYATRWGRPYAMKWLYWELAILAVKRVSPAVIISALATWLRRKIGL